MPTITEFEIIDLSWNWEDTPPTLGPGIFETCVTGEGNTQKEAINDAIAQVLEANHDDETSVAEILPAGDDFGDEEEKGESLVDPNEEPPIYFIVIRWNPAGEEEGEGGETDGGTGKGTDGSGMPVIDIEPAQPTKKGKRT